ncbi:DUF86 domain-containing protein [Syntrophotalea acetylenica]|uniref:HepT-like ribonuclease domain-containing protein n=1 Tax=Syntrophotalea acetylenica TaxID=29542 RepID=UPI002A36A550|nr:DUF86 domain-containing protein [Syntrophotalea acetylenica]MDY0263539.1 DUF86 domain-containing protein [Syntrophotalea acetylenica]
MSTKRLIQDYLDDILESISDIRTFIANMSYEEFIRDKKTINAVIRSLEVIGEAVKKIPQEVRQKHPDLPWKAIAGTRDKLIHEYFGIDLQILWKTIQSDLSPLEKAIMELRLEFS